MQRRLTELLLCLLAILGVSLNPALAGKRVALVIGNSAYQNVSQLPNPANDASDMAVSLERLGFAVTRASDLSYDGMRRALRDFGNEAAGADMTLVFFAGHGMEIGGENYLIPVDARLATDSDVRYEAVPLDMVMGAVERTKGLRLVLLDACRNNPFAASMKMTSASRAIGRGLARVEPSTGTLVGFAAKEGNVAADGSGRNSPYTRALLAKIEEPGLEVNFLFRQVRDQVLADTGGMQEPFTYGSLPGSQIYLKAPAPVAEVEPVTAPQPQVDAAASDYGLAAAIGSKAAWEAFLGKHGSETDNFYVQLARSALSKAEQEEAARKAPKAEPAVVASLEIGSDQASKDAERIKPDRALALQVQMELERIGCDPGTPDGVWGSGSERALGNYARYSKVRLATLQPNQQLLDDLRSQQDRICPLVCGVRYDVVGDKCVLKSCPSGQSLAADGKCIAATATKADALQSKSASGNSASQCGYCWVGGGGMAEMNKAKLPSRKLCGAAYLQKRGNRPWICEPAN